METSPAPWIEALRNSHDRLRAVVEPLDADELTGPSYASEWSIAQALSHLGSGAEIFGLFVEAGLAGQEPPGREAFGPIWDRWNAKSAQEQATDTLSTDGALVAQFEALDEQQRADLRLAMFGMDLDTTGLVRMRLSEHAMHTWDVAVARDPAATVSPDAVSLLIDTLGPLVARLGKPDGTKRELRIATTNPERHFVLETGDQVSLSDADGHDGQPDLQLPAEAMLRLTYGRLDPDHTPAGAEHADLDQVRPIFPGF